MSGVFRKAVDGWAISFGLYVLLCGGAILVIGARLALVRLGALRSGRRILARIVDFEYGLRDDSGVRAKEMPVFEFRIGSRLHRVRGTVGLATDRFPVGSILQLAVPFDRPDLAQPVDEGRNRVAPWLILAFGAFLSGWALTLIGFGS
ncbi:MAG: hypothetical protein AAGE05_05330 [Pseudomonadota bacterium]